MKRLLLLICFNVVTSLVYASEDYGVLCIGTDNSVLKFSQKHSEVFLLKKQKLTYESDGYEMQVEGSEEKGTRVRVWHHEEKSVDILTYQFKNRWSYPFPGEFINEMTGERTKAACYPL